MLASSLVMAAANAADNKPADAAKAESEAAMERAKRLAANPMRIILEAARVRRENAVATPANAGAVTTTAALSPAAVSAAAAPALAAPQPAAVAPTVAPALVPSNPVLSTMGAARVSTPLASETPSVAPMPAAPRLDLPTANLVAPAKAAGPMTITPKLVTMVEPEFAPRLLDDVARLGEVQADLTLRPDGTVANIQLRGSVPRTLQRSILVALERWRFEPLPAEHVHRVQLVFNEAR